MGSPKILAAVLGAAAFSGAVPAAGQPAATAGTYPARPVRILVPTPPGGGNDIMARMAAQKMNERWSQPIVVDNRPGAGGPPQQLATLIRDEIPKWTKVIKEAGIRLE